MKHFIILLVTLLMSVTGYANIVKEDNTYVYKTVVVEDQALDIFYQDKDGIKYTVYQSKKGSLYIIKVSKKTGNIYKYYLPKDIQKHIKEAQKNLNDINYIKL